MKSHRNYIQLSCFLEKKTSFLRCFLKKIKFTPPRKKFQKCLSPRSRQISTLWACSISKTKLFSYRNHKQNLLVFRRAISFWRVVWLKLSCRTISVTWNFLVVKNRIWISIQKFQKSLLGIFEVVLIVHPKEDSQLMGFLNFTSPIL